MDRQTRFEKRHLIFEWWPGTQNICQKHSVVDKCPGSLPSDDGCSVVEEGYCSGHPNLQRWSLEEGASLPLRLLQILADYWECVGTKRVGEYLRLEPRFQHQERSEVQQLRVELHKFEWTSVRPTFSFALNYKYTQSFA